MRKVKPGDRVTCQLAVEAYYSRYAGRPRVEFRPGMVGVVASLAPKVRLVDGPGHDRRGLFAVVDYVAPETGAVERVGLNLCNCVPIT
jgi:hypothetical protein